MGNYRFRLSDMMPNAWFYKLRDMSKPSRSHHHHPTIKKQLPTTAAKTTTTTSKSPKPSELKQPPNPPRPRKSYYFTRDLNLVPVDADFPDPPRKSAKQRSRRRNPRTSPKRVTSSAVSAGCRCRIDSVWTKSDSPPDFSSTPLDTSPEKNSCDEPPEGSFDGMVSNCCGSCRCRVNSVELDDKPFKTQIKKLDFDFDSGSDLHHLPPIITKPAGFNDMVNDIRRRDEPKKSKSNPNPQNPLSVKIVKEQSIAGGDQKPTIPARKSSPGVRLRTHSPKIGSKKVGRRSVSSTTTSSSSSAARRSISDSCAVVKSSFDPQRDFKESMMEMIVENNLRASKDLEDLLACYLSLNSDEYHELIIGVFKQIWFDLSDLKFK